MAATANSLEDLTLQRLDEHHGDVKAGLVLDFDKAGRTGHVDLGQVIADHVQSDQQKPAIGQRRTERSRDRAVSFRPRLGVRTAASSRYVATRYSRSKGGSLRINTTSKFSSGRRAASSLANHGSPCGRMSSRVASACTTPSRQARPPISQVQIRWPRRAISRII